MKRLDTIISFLGRVPYGRALALQEALNAKVGRGQWPDTLLLLEHPPVITLGRSSSPAHILAPTTRLAQMGIDVERVGRGGEVTYHGPGQLVGYAIRRVGRAVRAHVEGMAQGLAAYLGELGVSARWDSAIPGLWVDGAESAAAKIAAVGVEVRHGVSLHGFALNLEADLEHFALILPCGLDRPVCSVQEITGAAPSVAEAAPSAGAALARAWGVAGRHVKADEIWAAFGEERGTR